MEARQETEMNLPELPGFEVAWLDGVVFTSVDGRGVWRALREARGKLRDLQAESSPRMIFVRAVDKDGEPVTVLDTSAAALIIGYQLETI